MSDKIKKNGLHFSHRLRERHRPIFIFLIIK